MVATILAQLMPRPFAQAMKTHSPALMKPKMIPKTTETATAASIAEEVTAWSLLRASPRPRCGRCRA